MGNTGVFVDWCSWDPGQFLPSSKDRLSFGATSRGLVLEQSCRNTNTLLLAEWAVAFGRQALNAAFLNRSGWMHGCIGVKRDEWRRKSGTLSGLFILRAYTPIQDICDANSAQESQQCLLGSSLCVCVWVCVGVCGCTLKRYLSVHYSALISSSLQWR